MTVQHLYFINVFSGQYHTQHHNYLTDITAEYLAAKMSKSLFANLLTFLVMFHNAVLNHSEVGVAKQEWVVITIHGHILPHSFFTPGKRIMLKVFV